jgi:hypothetical protein
MLRAWKVLNDGLGLMESNKKFDHSSGAGFSMQLFFSLAMTSP